MHQKISKSIILNLIKDDLKDDLKHQHTIWGLSKLGFENNTHTLDICMSIFALMEFPVSRLEQLTDEYCERSYGVTELAVHDKEGFERLAEEVYAWLERERES